MVDNYKYHLAIGNHEGPHVFTERISDAFLGYAVPITFGCTNLADYFPEDSFIDIDLHSPDEAIQKIKGIIYNPDDYEKRLKSLVIARQKILDEYNLIPMLTKIIANHNASPPF